MQAEAKSVSANRDIKDALRKTVLARRDALPMQDREAASLSAMRVGEGFITARHGTVIGSYLPIRSEIDPRPLMAALARRGMQLCVPAVVDRQTIEFRSYEEGMTLVDTGFGTRGPGPSAQILTPEILIMPLAAFDRTGNRLGYGAGHYDRAIARLGARGIIPLKVGLAFDIQEVAAIPGETHDVPLDAVVTNAGTRQFTH